MTNTTNSASYQSFLAHHAIAQRAIGKYIVALIESGSFDSLSPRNPTSLVYENGVVKGTDHQVMVLISLSKVSHKRQLAALRALREHSEWSK